MMALLDPADDPGLGRLFTDQGAGCRKVIGNG